MPSISYAITACNEHAELERLLDQLHPTLRDIDEIVIQLDTTATEEVKEVAFKYSNLITVTAFPLAGDFAQFKNNLKNYCTKDYIFQIDADEYLSEELLLSLPGILELNPGIDLFAIPRINTVKGLTQEHIQKWGWHVSGNGWVNYPDYQTRILKNIPEIRWINKVHERLVGAKNGSHLPEEYTLIHPKTIERQEKQNNYYNTL
jgi:glycosyltransferase involved in cell wall biosynthesis